MLRTHCTFVVIAVALVRLLLGTVAQAGTVGWWRIENGGSDYQGNLNEVTDSSGNGHNGYALPDGFGNYPNSTSGSPVDGGYAIQLDVDGIGGDHCGDGIDIPQSSAFDMMFSSSPTTAYTIEADIKSNIGVIFEKMTGISPIKPVIDSTLTAATAWTSGWETQVAATSRRWAPVLP